MFQIIFINEGCQLFISGILVGVKEEGVKLIPVMIQYPRLSLKWWAASVKPTAALGVLMPQSTTALRQKGKQHNS